MFHENFWFFNQFFHRPKLAFAEKQVDVMKQDIIALQPELEATSIETQNIMEKIAVDKVNLYFLNLRTHLFFSLFEKRSVRNLKIYYLRAY